MSVSVYLFILNPSLKKKTLPNHGSSISFVFAEKFRPLSLQLFDNFGRTREKELTITHSDTHNTHTPAVTHQQNKSTGHNDWSFAQRNTCIKKTQTFYVCTILSDIIINPYITRFVESNAEFLLTVRHIWGEILIFQILL